MGRALLALVLLASALAHAKPKDKDKEKKRLEEEEAKELEAKNRLEAPGYWRWYDSIVAGQLKVNLIDTSEAPKLKLFVSILVGSDKSKTIEAVDDWEKEVDELEIRLAKGQDKLPRDPLVTFKGGVVPEVPDDTPADERPPAAEILPLDKANVGFDVVVVAAGHGGYKDVDQLETNHKGAVLSVLRKLGSANANVVWYGPMLYTYRSFEGIQGDLSRFDESLKQCEIDRLKWRIAQGEEKKDGDTGPPPPPCGLHEGGGKVVAGAVDKMPFRGKHARLFGIDRGGVNACSEESVASTALRFFDVEALEERTTDAGAFEEGLRLLLKYGRPGTRKVLVVIGDGHDGHIDEDAACRRLFTTSPKHCATKGDTLRGAAARKAIQDCVQQELDRRSSLIQERFRDRAVQWLALLRAADIRVFGLSYAMLKADGSPLAQKHERERIEMLSLKTGGTYREVYTPSLIDGAATALADEILRERVILVDAGLESEADYKLALRAVVVRGKKSAELFAPGGGTYEFTAPFIGSGFWYAVQQKSDWLRNKVGVVLWWVIVIGAGLLALLLLWLVFKLLKALVMTIVKAFAKKGGEAVKGAGKAVEGAGKGAVKGVADAGKAAAKAKGKR